MMKWKVLGGIMLATCMTVSTYATTLVVDHNLRIQLPNEIEYFDARHVKTPTSVKDMVAPMNDPKVQNKLQMDLHMSEEEVKDFIDHLRIYQLQGKDQRGLHIAYVINVKITPSLYRHESIAPTSYAPSKVSVTYPKVYDKDIYYALRGEENRANHAYNASAASINKSVQHILSSVRQAYKEQLRNGTASLTTSPRLDLLQSQYVDLFGIEITNGWVNTPVTIGKDKGYYSKLHESLYIDEFKLPFYLMGISRFAKESEYITLMIMNDASHTYWTPIIEKAWAIGGK